VLSEDKSQAIVDLIKERFNETDHAPVARKKEEILVGDRSEDSHMLSRKMMQTYIGSYWYHFSEQVPICKCRNPPTHGKPTNIKQCISQPSRQIKHQIFS